MPHSMIFSYFSIVLYHFNFIHISFSMLIRRQTLSLGLVWLPISSVLVSSKLDYQPLCSIQLVSISVSEEDPWVLLPLKKSQPRWSPIWMAAKAPSMLAGVWGILILSFLFFFLLFCICFSLRKSSGRESLEWGRACKVIGLWWGLQVELKWGATEQGGPELQHLPSRKWCRWFLRIRYIFEG